MTALLITVDTELSALLHQRGVGLTENVRRSIWAEVDDKGYGIGWQMDRLERHGLKGVFFLDPMPALVHGPEFLKPIIAAVVERGHEVQLHIHTEWLAWATHSPVGGRQGRNIGDFSLADQAELLGMGRQWLEEAGAPPVTAFRAGNFGANDDTLRALAQIGIGWDSSLNPSYLGRECQLTASRDQIAASRLLGVAELPVSAIADQPGSLRAAQVCAMSAAEMRAGLRHGVAQKQDAFVVVTHSFEMLSRDRRRPNHAVMDRFTALCRLAGEEGVRAAGFNDLPFALADAAPRALTRLAPSRPRTMSRMGQQLWANWRYERQLKPA